MRILGFDPGLHGAMGLIDTEAGTLAVRALPIAKRQLTTTVKQSVDEYALADAVRAWHPDVAWLEDVWARGGGGEQKGEGAVGAFSFGESKGILRGCLGALHVPVHYVAPARWKADLRVPAAKPLAKLRAHALFPACIRIITSEGKAEAAMITLFGCLAAGQVPPKHLTAAG